MKDIKKGGTALKQKRLPGVDFSRLWRESGAVLSEGSNRLTLILAIMVAVSPLPIYQALLSVQSILVSRFHGKEMLVYGSVALAMLGLTVFFTLPLFFGLFRMASEMEQGSVVLLQDVLGSFSSGPAYRTAIRASVSALWRILLLCAMEIAAARFVFSLRGERGALLALWTVLIIGSFVLWYMIAARGFFGAYVALRNPNLPERMQPYARSLAFHYGWGSLPWLVLSLFTFGILLLADVLPRMLIAYFRLCTKLNEITTRSEEI